MFYGINEVKLSKENRIVLPRDFALEDLVVTYIDEDTLVFFKASEFNVCNFFKNTNLNSVLMTKYKNYILMHSKRISIDSQRRISIPKEFKLSFTDGALVGRENHFTLVNKKKFYQEQEEAEREFQEFLRSEEGKIYKKSLNLEIKSL